MKYLFGIAFCVAICFFTGKAQAGWALQAADASDLTTLGSASFGNGTAPVSLNLYLVNVAPGTGAFSADLASFNLNRTNNPGGGAFTATNPVPPNLFAQQAANVTGANSVEFVNLTLFANPVNSITLNAAQVLYVGSLNVAGPSGSTQDFAFVIRNADDIFVGDFGGANQVNVTADTIANSAGFSVSVPEPSSFAILGGLGAFLTFRRRRAAV